MNKKALQVCIKSAKLLLCGLKIIILRNPKVPDGHIGYGRYRIAVCHNVSVS